MIRDDIGVGVADEHELEAACRAMRPRLVGFLSLYCGNAALGEELAQETLARVWTNWAKVSRLQSPTGWAHRVALNLANSHLRRRHVERRVRALIANGELEAEPPVDHAAALDVRRAVAGLPRRQRAAIVLRYFVDLSVDDTAKALGCAPGTVKSLTHKAIKALAEAVPIAEEA
jgi:RNA polymerase sigma-70 factor (ECF subfamily)